MPTPPAKSQQRCMVFKQKLQLLLVIDFNRSRQGMDDRPIDRCYACTYVPSVSALTKIMDARMKMMSDERPSHAISFLTQCCPVMAATNATPVK